jgi:hypothetical protein
MEVELEHGRGDPATDVTGDDPRTGKIALAHLKEFPDYYTWLKRMEEEAHCDPGQRRRAGTLSGDARVRDADAVGDADYRILANAGASVAPSTSCATDDVRN